MGRKALPVPSVKLTTSLDSELMTKLDLRLWSEVEGRIPQGAYKAHLERLLREDFETKRLDLSPYIGSPLGAVEVRGHPASIEALIKHFTQETT